MEENQQFLTNTNPDFFSHWTAEQMKNELARLNLLLEDCKKDLIKMETILIKGKSLL